MSAWGEISSKPTSGQRVGTRSWHLDSAFYNPDSEGFALLFRNRAFLVLKESAAHKFEKRGIFGSATLNRKHYFRPLNSFLFWLDFKKGACATVQRQPKPVERYSPPIERDYGQMTANTSGWDYFWMVGNSEVIQKRASRKLWGRVSTLRTTFASQKERWPAGPPRGLERLREPSLQELSKLRGGLELRDGIQFLECRRERIGKTPDRSRPEFLVLRIEVKVMHGAGEVFGSFECSLDERLVDDHLGGDVRQFTFLPCFHLLSHRLEVSLHSVDSNRDTVDQRERLRVFGKHGGKISGERHVRAHEYAIPTSHC